MKKQIAAIMAALEEAPNGDKIKAKIAEKMVAGDKGIDPMEARVKSQTNEEGKVNIPADPDEMEMEDDDYEHEDAEMDKEMIDEETKEENKKPSLFSKVVRPAIIRAKK